MDPWWLEWRRDVVSRAIWSCQATNLASSTPWALAAEPESVSTDRALCSSVLLTSSRRDGGPTAISPT